MKRKPALIRLLLAFLFLLVLGLQSGYCQLTGDPYILEQGIAYGMSEVVQLTLNIAIPKTDGVFPCIVYIGWGGVASYDTIAAILRGAVSTLQCRITDRLRTEILRNDTRLALSTS